jgi:3-dehydroquinate dehydratase
VSFRADIFTSNDLPDEALSALRRMVGQLPIVFALRAGGEVRVPVAEVDATGGYLLNIEIRGADFIFKASKKQ